MVSRSTQILVGLLCSVLVTFAAVDSRLSTAAMNGDTAAVQLLLKQNVDINAAQGDGMTALHWAVNRDDLEMARLLVGAAANVKATTRLGGITPIFMAAQNGDAAMIDLLIKAGADVNAANSVGTTPLMLAAASGNAEAVRLLLSDGADVNARDETNGQTALMFAAALNRADAMKVLADRGADLNITSKVLEPPAGARGRGQAAQQGQQAQRAQQGNGRVRPGRERANANVLGGLTALHFAAREGQMDAVRVLVAAGANVNQVAASDKMSVITSAIINGHFDIAKFLLDNGADPKLASTGGLTPLFATIDQQWAARTWYPAASVDEEKTNYLDLMKELLAKGADPNAKMGPKLWFRSFHGDWVDPAGATAFWRAAQSDDIAAMRLLVAAGADPNIPTAHGGTPLQAAAGYGIEPQVTNFVPDARLAAVKYLVEELNADVNAKDDKGYTPLHGAALTGNNELILYLVSKGADVKARASMIYGRADDTNQDVAAGSGDTVADMANGPRERNLVYPDTVALLVKLGSINSDNCRASTCVLKTQSGKKPQQQ